MVVMVAIGVAAAGPPVGASAPSAAAPAAGTPLPSGWEQCILQGIGAPVNGYNVADLDEWQVVEGGSTANTAAYNPFNTRQLTDATGAALPVVVSSDGFPAFTTWAAGCAATVATLLQPDMAPIVAALRSGVVALPGVFLADVDQSPWCAPSADGVPCYASEILAGELLGVLLSGGSGQLKDAMTSYLGTGADLRTYEQDAAVTAADQQVLTARDGQLTAADQDLAAAQGRLSEATEALRRLALEDYTGDAGMRSSASLALFAPPDESGLVAQYLGAVAASTLADRYDRARVALAASSARRQAAQEAVNQSASLVAADTAAQNQVLSTLQTDVKSVETGLSCPAPSLVSATPSPAGSPASAPAVGKAPKAGSVDATTSTSAPHVTTTTTTAPPAGGPATTAPAGTAPTVPAGTPATPPPVSAGQLWATLQQCLAPPAPVGVSPSGALPS
jgi:hypothetical protein